MTKRRQDAAKKRLMLFFGVSAMAFAGAIGVLGSLSARAEEDPCAETQSCMEIANVNSESGYVIVEVENHADELVGFLFDRDGEYDDGADKYMRRPDVHTVDYRNYYIVSDDVDLSNVFGFHLYRDGISRSDVNLQNFSDYYTPAIVYNDEVLATFTCSVEGEPEYYDDDSKCVPDVIVDTEGQALTALSIPERDAKFVVYKKDEVPEFAGGRFGRRRNRGRA